MVKKLKKSKKINAGANLKEIRLELGLSQQEVGDLVGTGQSYISAIENSRQDFRAALARNLIKAFKKNYKRTISPIDFGLED